MKNHAYDDLSGMKKEDGRYGDNFSKTHSDKDHNKKEKYVPTYKNMKSKDFVDPTDETYEYDDGYEVVKD